ncbi:MAG: hypothetical protein GEV06_03240 [Luteitalea sp.]|nr:hypothetical protein [Luteitalea sp.]
MLPMTSPSLWLARYVPGMVVVLLALSVSARASAETGYDLWLRYAPIEEAPLRDKLRRQVEDAAAWRDKCLRYFQRFSRQSVPAFRDAPAREAPPM